MKSLETKWFMMPMATGAMGVFTFILRDRFLTGAMTGLAVTFALLTLLSFLLMGTMFIGRLFKDMEGLKKDAVHPLEANFFAAISIAASVSSTVTSRVLIPAGLLSSQSGGLLAGILYLIGMALGLGFLWMTVRNFTLSENIVLPNAVGIWLLPPVGLFVSIFAGNFWALLLDSSSAHTVLMFNLLVFGAAFVVYLFVMGLIYQRGKMAPLPPAPLAPSFFVPLAPPGVLVIALWSFAAVMKKLPAFETFLPFFISVSVLLSIIMIGFGLFWLVLAGLLSWHYKKVPFTLGYWAYVFPINALGISIMLSARHPLLTPLNITAIPLWLLGLFLWFFVFWKTIQNKIIPDAKK